jgi:hypothetical protein
MRRYLAMGLCGVVLCGGCYRDFDKPEYQEVDTADTAYLVPLEGDTTSQAKFDSEQFLEDKKVASKRVQITHRWNQTGRWMNDGEWIANVRLIKVNRSPITREWTADSRSGTSPRDQAIWVESQDSVGFSMGFTVTGYIKEEDASKFLYWYPSTDKDGTASLAQVMDTEVRARVQQAVSEVASKYPLDLLRAKKQEMTDAAREDVIKFFATRGITISTVASFGGMTYENPEIQKAIDNVFVAQQDKAVNLARFEAQQKTNDRVELEAEATAEKLRREAKGAADAKVIEAEGEAKSLLARSEAIKEAGPGIFQLRDLEIEQARVEKWDGRYPIYMMETGEGKSPDLLLNLPQPQLTRK